jgi:hypothetical protein
VKDPRPAPPVTISGGPAPAAGRDLPDARCQRQPDQDREPQRARTRRTPLVLVGLGLLAALGVAELQERRAAEEAARAEAQRRLEAVDLELTTVPSGSTSYEPGTDSVTFLVLLRVRNEGLRPVTVTAVDLPGVQLLAPATLEVGGERGLTLRGQRSCTYDVGALLDLDRLPLDVRTETGQKSVDLAIEGTLLYGDAIRRACGLSRPGLS